MTAMGLTGTVRTALSGAVVAMLLATGSACTPTGQQAAWDVAAEFQAALRSRDGDSACRLLSDEARHRLESASARQCRAALEALSLPAGPARSIQTWGGNSQVHLDGAVLFLAEFRSGWRVTAAGCTPRPDQPYDCVVAA